MQHFQLALYEHPDGVTTHVGDRVVYDIEKVKLSGHTFSFIDLTLRVRDRA
jgi:hypothetical protein